VYIVVLTVTQQSSGQYSGWNYTFVFQAAAAAAAAQSQLCMFYESTFKFKAPPPSPPTHTHTCKKWGRKNAMDVIILWLWNKWRLLKHIVLLWSLWLRMVYCCYYVCYMFYTESSHLIRKYTFSCIKFRKSMTS